MTVKIKLVVCNELLYGSTIVYWGKKNHSNDDKCWINPPNIVFTCRHVVIRVCTWIWVCLINCCASSVFVASKDVQRRQLLFACVCIRYITRNVLCMHPFTVIWFGIHFFIHSQSSLPCYAFTCGTRERRCCCAHIINSLWTFFWNSLCCDGNSSSKYGITRAKNSS